MAEFSLTAPVRFFAGAEAPTGYVGYMSEIGRAPAWQTYLLKGGLSEDKRALLTAAAQLAAPWEPELELLMRSHREIEGVVCPQCRLCVLDATAPHAIDPTYWELSERLIATDGGLLPERLLPMADTIIELTDNERLLGERYRKFAAAAASLLSENARMAWGCTDTDKIRRLAVRIAAAEVFSLSNGRRTAAVSFRCHRRGCDRVLLDDTGALP